MIDESLKHVVGDVSLLSMCEPYDRWQVRCPGMEFEIGVDQQLGIALSNWRNTSGPRPVGYAAGPISLLPFVPKGGWQGTWEAAGGEYGGREVAYLRFSLESFNLRLVFHVAAYPGTPVIRYWCEVENRSFSRDEQLVIQPLQLNIALDDFRDTYVARYFVGGNSQYDQGLMRSAPLGRSGKLELTSNATYHYVPLVLLDRANPPFDGLMSAVDYCGKWRMNLDYDAANVKLQYTLDDGKPLRLRPGEKVTLPAVTLAAYTGDGDNLMRGLYDWQYTYLWDYTNPDYHAKTRGIGNWVYCARNLHEQFAWRLASFDLRGAQEAQSLGYEMFWDDAGWSAYPGWPPDEYASVFQNNYDGPDFRLAQCFFEKCGLKWLCWFAGVPARELLQSKEAAWGAFEWRTDAFGVEDLRDEAAVKEQIRTYLQGNRQRSFHTCSGGSTYSHTFDMQRYANYNYLADGGAGPYLNYYYSYFETPDRWGDVLLYLGDRLFRHDGSTSSPVATYDQLNDQPHYSAELGRSRLSMVPITGPSGELVNQADREAVRKDIAIYRYLRRQGLAGRWSYLYHPAVFGDEAHYYYQRTNRDVSKACIIIGRRPSGRVTIYPKALQPELEYAVSFQESVERYTRPGRVLMEEGITLAEAAPGELVYLNLPDHPGATLQDFERIPPGQVLARQEQNIGLRGAGIYWSTAQPADKVSYYEVARDGIQAALVATGKYWFDADAQATSSAYAVRAVYRDGQTSAWRQAQAIADEAPVYSALGGFGSPPGSNAWTAEYSYDLKTFTPMKRVAPENNPAADFGGKHNQPGGIEGYWEKDDNRVGRGWLQAGAGGYSCLRFTAPRGGRVRVSGKAVREWYHQGGFHGAKVAIRLNNEQIWPEEGFLFTDGSESSHDLNLDLKMGDILRFVVQGSGHIDLAKPWEKEAVLVGWIPVITYQPDPQEEPASTPGNLRIACGRSKGVTDESGSTWLPDQDYDAESRAIDLPELASAGTLYTGARTGRRIQYRIPLAPSLYTLRLAFADPDPRESGQRSFQVWLNGELVSPEVDIAAEVFNQYQPYERIYHYLVPGADGCLDLELAATTGEALLQGIEAAPEARDHLLVNCGAVKPYIDWSGQVWEADTFSEGESLVTSQQPSQATPTLYDAALYQTARSGREINYRLPVRPGIYELQLKFAELWDAAPGQRPVDIKVNGKLVRAGWDTAREAGRAEMATGLRLTGISPVEGAIWVTLTATGSQPATIQALEVE
ncbi:MAG: malectin domain-containing carbohydrate-binding protein [Anaerolineae bacterium]